MAKYRAVIIGAGRIGAGWNWHDDEYTHAGAYRALKDRVELVAFVESDKERAKAAQDKWGVECWNIQTMQMFKPDIVSICVQPEQQRDVLPHCNTARGIWCEKPFMADRIPRVPTQINYMRRADRVHQLLASRNWPQANGDSHRTLIAYAKDDIHTRCHFEDLASWWKADLVYRRFDGPCSYVLRGPGYDRFFDNGGVNPAECFRGMLGNLLDALEGKAELWSPPRPTK